MIIEHYRDRIHSILKEERPAIIAGALLLVITLLLLQIPLLNTLGYEFSCAIALLVPWCCGIPALRSMVKSMRQANAGDRKALGAVMKRSAGTSLLLLAIPFFAGSLAAIVVKNCSYAEGVMFFLLLPGVTAVWTLGFGFFCAAIFRKPLRAYVALNLILLLYPLYIGYVSPQIYSYHPVYGYFPGFSYDEVLRITPTLLLFRLVTLIAALLLALLALAVLRSRWRRRSGDEPPVRLSAFLRPDRLEGGILWTALLVAAALVFRDRLGFETSTASIRRVLSSAIRTEHFLIFYAPGSFTGDEARWVAAEHEFRLAQVEAALRTGVRGVISSYIYPDDESKRRLIGTATTNIAKPWLREIHLGRDSWEGTLRHELVHVVAGAFGMPVIRANYRTGIVEGLAMAVDDDFGNRTLHEYAAAIVRFGIVRNPQRLIGTVGFMTQASSVSYVLAGSFCRYLLDRYGVFRFKDLYGGGSPATVYGKSLDELSKEWQQFLDRTTVPDSWRNHVFYYFRRPSIFAKECARAIAGMNELAYDDLRAHRPERAMNEFSAALSASWNSESYAGLVQAAAQAGRPDTVIRLVGDRLRDSTGRAGAVSLFLLYGDALWRNGETSRAEDVYRELLAYDLSERTDEAAALRLEAIGDPVLRSALSGYFGGARNDSAALERLAAARAVSKSPLLDYLEALVRYRQGRYEEAVRSLSGRPPSFSLAALNAGRELLLARALFRIGSFQQARIHFWESLNYVATPASQERVDDWIERCEWFEVNGGGYLRHPGAGE